MESKYNHKTNESKIYSLWEEAETFCPEINPDGDPFTIIMPPPNANDPLHVGHAMFVALEDIMIRYQRMRGKAALWLPGTDHAGIETQFVFEKKLVKEGKSRFNFDRETLFQMIWKYVENNSKIAKEQLRQIGASADWTRFKFTLDPDIVNTVVATFEKLFADGLVYRDLRLVNYCTKCGTAFSDLEVEHKEQVTKLYYVKYELVDQPGQFVVVATTRPEPIFVDTHLAVHPRNYKTEHLIGKQVLNPVTGDVMTIIADEFVDPEFGSGVVKLTPAHDFTDFEVAKTHNLPIIQAVDTQGKIVVTAPLLAGLSVNSAREEVVKILTKKNLIEKIDEDYQNRVGVCYRCGRVLEPLPLAQFFIKVDPLKKQVLEDLISGKLKVIGAGHDKILKHWLENLKDWNISRQIVWGIRLPVWYKLSTDNVKINKNNEIEVVFLDKNGRVVRGVVGELIKSYSFDEIKVGLQSLRAPLEAEFVVSPTPPGENYLQDTDTFDTWFSSAQWPFATLQNTRTGDFNRFYPTQVMETGYDILPFWVMRMLLISGYATGKQPFNTVYLHGLVRDTKGQKMSKSKGNVINPVEVVDKYGADALRLALVIRSTPGLDKSVGESDFKAMRNFTNKIWNAARFVVMNLNINSERNVNEQMVKSKKGAGDGKNRTGVVFKTKLNDIVGDVTRHLENYRIGVAVETIYNEFWHWYCDECIEKGKQGELLIEDLLEGMVVFLKLLHPFAPFISESVYQQLRSIKGVQDRWMNLESEKLLIISRWPMLVGNNDLKN